MYPATFFGLFPPFRRTLRAFVAMSFEARFDLRWQSVLRPGIENVLIDGAPLEPHRIDLAMSGDSVLTEILDDISRCAVIVADITALGRLADRPVRNENVFYEIGLAHAVRLPEEVVLFRSDDEPLAFDISNVRVHQYDPDGNPEGARTKVADILVGSLKELQLRRHLAIRWAAERLHPMSLMILEEAQSANGMTHPERKSMGEMIAVAPVDDAISRLLELTAIRAEFQPFAEIKEANIEQGRKFDWTQSVRYRATPFGMALFEYLLETIHGGSRAMQGKVTTRESAPPGA